MSWLCKPRAGWGRGLGLGPQGGGRSLGLVCAASWVLPGARAWGTTGFSVFFSCLLRFTRGELV